MSNPLNWFLVAMPIVAIILIIMFFKQKTNGIFNKDIKKEYMENNKITGAREYNYCFTAQKQEKVNSALMGIFGGALGGAVAHKLNDSKSIGYILNKNENGIAILPIIGDIKNPIVDVDNLLFLNNEDIDKVVVKKDGFSFKIIKIVLKNKEEYSFRMANKIKNIDYHEANLNDFIECYK